MRTMRSAREAHREIERHESPHSNFQEKFSEAELAALEQEFLDGLEADKASAAAALERAQALRKYDDEEHARLHPLYVKLNGGYDHRDLSLDAED